MKCDFKIMGVEERIENIKQTVNVLNLSMDDVFLDKEMRMNPLLSSLDVLRMPTEKGITHRCILQDDIELSANFKNFVNYLINSFPNEFFTLYSYTGQKPDVTQYGTIYETGKIWGQAVVIPLKYREDIFAYYEEKVKKDYIHDDGFYSVYANKHGVKILATMPNTVKMLDSKSYFGHRFGLKSKTFCLIDPMMYEWEYKPDDWKHTTGIRDKDIFI
jgi:hypothetical protein